jgi:hypothetical protein
MQRRGVWVVALCALVGLCFFGTADAGAKPPVASCDTQVNDTAATLLPCIKQSDLHGYMQDLATIAEHNPSPADNMPSRNSGEPGYKASADYVAAKMQSWGYDVKEQKYQFPYFAYTSLPTMSESSPTAQTFVVNSDFVTGNSIGSVTNATVQPVGGIIIPPTATPSSASGCTMGDFTGFQPGNIALIQRGTCNFGVKVQNAAAAKAGGVIIFNEGNPTPDGSRTDLFGGTIEDANDTLFVPQIPVDFTSFAFGETLYNDYLAKTPAVMSFSIQGLYNLHADDWNVIADSKGGDTNHTVVIDAHLDAIYGEGMLDNASGSVTILDLARMLKNVDPTNHLRFIWFGGEELGLLGSTYYVSTLSSNDLSHIGYDLDADVTATPNYTLGILDPAGKDLFSDATTADTFPNRVYKASLIARDAGVNYLTSQGKNHEFFSPEGTDAYEFNLAGVPASGVLTGQDCCKTQHEVDLFGGTTGQFEGFGFSTAGCVDNPFLWCDNLYNNDFAIMTLVSRTFATMALTMAFDTKVMSASTSVVYKKTLPIAGGEASRHLAAS